MNLHSLPLHVRLAGKPVILLGEGPTAAAKRLLLARAGAEIVGEGAQAAFAIVAIEDEAVAEAAVARLKARGILVNATDRPALCDFTLPAIVERGDVIVAVGTGGVSAGLAAALRQRLEALLPAGLGGLARSLHAAREALRRLHPDAADRRRALGEALAAGGPLDPLVEHAADAVEQWLAGAEASPGRVEEIRLRSPDPDELTLREARLLALADRLHYAPDVPVALLDRARADAERIPGLPAAGAPALPGLTLILTFAA